MKNSFFIFLLILFCFISCNKINQKEIVFEKIRSVTCKSIIKDIPLKIPGDFIVMDSIIMVCDPLSSKSIFKLYDIKTGKFLFEGANKGHGPSEILTPSNIDIRDNSIQVYDNNLRRNFNYSINWKDSTIIPEVSNWEKFGQSIFKVIKLSSNVYVTNSDQQNYLFSCIDPLKDKRSYFGDNQIINTENISNSVDVFQGTLRTDKQGTLFAFAAFNTPYMCLYEMKNGEFVKQFATFIAKPSYKIINKELVWNDDNISGFMDMAIANKHIYVLHSNLKKSEIKGRSIDALPRTLYEFDFNGIPLCKYNLDKPFLRIAGDKQGRIFGVTLENNKYNIVEILIN